MNDSDLQSITTDTDLCVRTGHVGGLRSSVEVAGATGDYVNVRNMAAELSHLRGISRALADSNTIEARPARTFWCRLCHAKAALPFAQPSDHAEDCPWRQAVEWAQQHPR